MPVFTVTLEVLAFAASALNKEMIFDFYLEKCVIILHV